MGAELTDTPIGDYALIGDCRSAALISKNGSLDWLCWPRFDSSSIFTKLLDASKGGQWAVAPNGPSETRRSYLDGTNVLESVWKGPGGRLTAYEFMPAGKFDGLYPEHAVIRLYRCDEGTVRLDGELSARAGYGRKPLRFREHARCLRAGHQNFQFSLQAYGCHYEIAGETLRMSTTLHAGQRVAMVLTANREGPAVFVSELQLWRMLDATVKEWQQWSAQCTYSGPYRSEVLRSALALKSMIFAPSGAIVAAPTASLPESIGGDKNWDYRYCWLRDASHTTRALWELGYESEADAFVSWLLHATRLSRPRLRVLYDVFGRRPPRETEATWLRGYAGSRPVRIGNAAESQKQLDLYGEVIDAAYQRIVNAGNVDHEAANLLLDLAKYVANHWRERDAGIWEYRDELRHHTHSKLLCWVAVDRVIKLQEKGCVPAKNSAGFRREREAIERFILEQAADADGVLTAAANDPELDASVILAASFGFLEPDDPWMQSTFAAITRRLGSGDDLLYRAERFVSHEGAFLFCSFWAIEYLTMRGDLELAEKWFRRLLALRNELGLYSEEVEVGTGRALGNFPQAFSHVGLVNAALALEKARSQEIRRRNSAAHQGEAWP